MRHGIAPTTSRRPRSSAPQRPGRARSRGFTLAELLVVTGIIVVLLGILLPVVASVRRSAQSVNCLGNLRNIATGFQRYAADNNGRLPNPLFRDQSWEEKMLKYVGGSAGIYVCPADDELAESLGTSYDWRDTGDPATTLAGMPLSDAKSETVLVYDSLPNWHARQQMNAAYANGSASAVDVTACLTDLMTPLRASSTGTTRRGRGRP